MTDMEIEALSRRIVLLVLMVLLVGYAWGGDEEAMSRGEAWIRSHPFQVSAFIEFPVNLEAYQEIGFTSLMATLPGGAYKDADKVFGAAAEAGLDWHWFYRWKPATDNDELLAKIKEYFGTYSHGVGVVIGDENPQGQHEALGPVLEAARGLVPEALIYHAMQGKDMYPKYTHEPETYYAYLDSCVNVLKPDVYMYDQYPFYRKGTATNFYENLGLVRERSDQMGVACMNWLQGFSWTEGPFDVPSESQLRLQAFVSLAYGHKGFSYWTYCSPYKPYAMGVLNHDGSVSDIGRRLKGILPEVKRLGEVMKSLSVDGVYYCPSMMYAEGSWVAVQPKGTTQWMHTHTPDILDVAVSTGKHGFVLSRFHDDDGQEYMMLVNTRHGYEQGAEETSSTITVRFLYTVGALEKLNRFTGEWERVPLFQHTLLHHSLPGGTGDLFRIVK